MMRPPTAIMTPTSFMKNRRDPAGIDAEQPHVTSSYTCVSPGIDDGRAANDRGVHNR